MLLAIVTGMLCGAVLVGTALVRVAQPDHDIAQVKMHTSVVNDALTRAHQAIGEASDDVRLALATPDAAERARLIGRAAASNDRATRVWQQYKQATLDLPGERALSHRVEVLSAQQLESAPQLLGASLSGPGAVVTAESQLAAGDRARLVPIEQIRAIYQHRQVALLQSVDAGFDGMASLMIIMFGILGVLWIPIVYVTMRGAVAEERVLRASMEERRHENRRAQLETGVQRALEMSRNEDAAYAVIAEALRTCSPTEHLGEFLVADSSRAHFRQVSGTGSDGEGPGCPVAGPADCPATNSGQTHTFPSSTRIDACPQLRDREAGACSAVCVPVGIAGRTIGVLHVTAPDDHPPDDDTVADLELVARKAGERIGMLRAFARTETEARTDPLTGLLNRRSLENRARRLGEQGTPYAVAFADLDHFKALNTAHGHETGDRALRIFSRTLRDTIRPDDIPARWGGEEFVVLLPDCALPDAHIVAERLRERLAWVLDKGDTPHFTVSIGLACGEPGVTFNEVVAHADQALLHAKTAGRDQVVIADPDRDTIDPSFDSPPRALVASVRHNGTSNAV